MSSFVVTAKCMFKLHNYKKKKKIKTNASKIRPIIDHF